MATQTEIKLIEATDSAPENTLDIKNSSQFIDELKKSNINDLDDSRLSIKKDGQRYLFEVNGENRFSVSTQGKFVEMVKAFYEQKNNEETNIVVDTTSLKLSILAGTGPLLKNTSDAQNYQIEQSNDLNGVLRRVAIAKDFFINQSRTAGRNNAKLSQNSASREKAGYSMTKEAADAQLKVLNSMEKRIQEIMKPGAYKTQEAFDQDYNITLSQFSQKLSEIENTFSQFSVYHNEVVTGDADTTPYFDISKSMNNVVGAKRIYEILKKYNNKEIKIENTTLNAAKQQLYARDLQDLEKYLDKIINDGTFNPATNHFESKYQDAINYLASDVQIKTMLMDVTKENNQNDVVITDSKLQAEYNKLTPKEKVAYADWKDAFAKGGIDGLASYGLDQTKMSPEQKETWKGVGNLAVTGGLIFLGWKFVSTAFKALSKSGREKLNKEGGRGWLWMPVAGTLGANALMGESPLALLNGGKGTEYLTTLFGGKPGQKSEIAETYTTGLTGACALFAGRTCSQVAETIETDSNGKMKLKPSFYNDIVSLAKGVPSDKNKLAAAQFLEKIGKDDPNNLIDTTLSAIGLSADVLRDSKNANTSFNERAADAIAKLASVTEYMEHNHFDRINKDQLPLIQKYIAGATPEDLETLQSRRGDIFENSETAPDDATKEALGKKVDALTLTDEQKQELKSALNNFWGLWPISKDLKKLDIKQDGSYVNFTTYDKTIKLDIANHTIVGLVDKNKNKIGFASTFELLKVANLTNRIFDLVKNNQNPVTKDPFNVSWIGGDVEYDNTKFWSNPVDRFNHLDTTVVSGGYAGALSKISPILEQNKEGYVTLLNTEYNKINNLK